MIHYSVFSTFVYAYNFTNEEPFKSIPKFWIQTKSRLFLWWGCFRIGGPFPFHMCLSWSHWMFQLALRAFTSVWASEQHLLWDNSAIPPTKLFNTKGNWKLEWWWVYTWDCSTKLGTDLIRWLYCYLKKFFWLLSGIRDDIYSPGIETE